MSPKNSEGYSRFSEGFNTTVSKHGLGIIFVFSGILSSYKGIAILNHLVYCFEMLYSAVLLEKLNDVLKRGLRVQTNIVNQKLDIHCSFELKTAVLKILQSCSEH